MTLLKTAKQFIKKGLSVVATDDNKRSIVPWKAFQKSIPTVAELESQFSSDRAKGLAIICGSVSGNLEVIDVDCKYDLTGTLFERLMASIHDASPALSDKLMVVRTKSGGYHLYYRCREIAGNQKLAQRAPSAEELKDSPNEKVLVLIETRGEGGYVVAPPSAGYTKVSGTGIEEITPSERETLLEISRSFNELIIELPKPHAARASTDNFAVTPWEDYNRRGVEDMHHRLQAHGWTLARSGSEKKTVYKRPGNSDSKSSGDFNHELNLFTVFTTSSVFEPLKGYRPAAVFTMLEYNGDFSQAAKKLSEMGYGERSIPFDTKLSNKLFQKKQEGYVKEDLVKIVMADKQGTNEEKAQEIIDQLDKQWGEKICAFWDVIIDAENKKRLNINKSRFLNFLHDVGGFGLYFYDTASTIYRIIRVKDGFVEESSTEQMKKFILEYLEGLPDNFDKGTTPDNLKELIISKYAALFNDGFLEFLPHYHLDFLRDDRAKGYFPFRNGVVVIDQSSVTLHKYKDINKVIWKKQVIDFNISIDQSFAPETCEYYRFIEKVSGDEPGRIAYAVTLLGYLLHRYKNPSKPYAVILAEETENEKDGGGTGKGIWVKAISKLVRTVGQDGKTFTPDKTFANQRVSLDTQLVAVEDCVKNLDFEKFNSQITEGMVVEKKNKDELYIEYKDSPKYLFTTNYTVNIKGNHGKRRSKVFEFFPFFGPKNKPEAFFGHLLFEDWDDDEWNRFYNLMFFCLSTYLQNDILETLSSDKIKRKEVRLNFGDEFLEWWDDYTGNGCATWKPFKELYNNFMVENDYEKKDFSQKRFKKALEIASGAFEKQVQTRRNRDAANRHEVRVLEIEDSVPDNRVPGQKN